MSTISEQREQSLETQEPPKAWEPVSPVPAAHEMPQTIHRPEIAPQGIGGWLILVAFGLTITPLLIAYNLAKTYLPIFTSGTWGMITTSGSELYNPVLAGMLVFEILANLFLIGLSCLCIVNLYGKRKPFPKLYITLLASSVAYQLLDLMLGVVFIPNQPDILSETASRFIWALIAAVVWGLYTLKSKRVKATFVQ